jgi:ferritin-like metal-binding protein YciE
MNCKTSITRHQINKALPKLVEQTTNRDLKQTLNSHLDETKKQIDRLDQVFKKLGQSQGCKLPRD